MAIEWFPMNGLDPETGAHGCRKLACGHFVCALAESDTCQMCADLRMKADAERRAKEKKAEQERAAKEAAKKAQIETHNIWAPPVPCQTLCTSRIRQSPLFFVQECPPPTLAAKIQNFV